MGDDMTAGEITAVGGVAGTVVAALLKGLPAVVNSFSKARRDARRARAEDEAEAEAERVEANARREAEVHELRGKLQAYADREHACEIKLTKALAWLAHLEAALKKAGIDYVPYNESGRADSDPSAVKPPDEAAKPPGDEAPPRSGIRPSPKRKGQ